MKKVIMVIMLMMVLVSSIGCVVVRYNTETKEISYTRLGDQSLSGIVVETPDGWSILIENQKSEATLMTDAIGAALKLYELGRAAK